LVACVLPGRARAETRAEILKGFRDASLPDVPITDTSFYERTTTETTNFDTHPCDEDHAKISLDVSLRLGKKRAPVYALGGYYSDAPETLRDSSVDHAHHRRSTSQMFGASEPKDLRPTRPNLDFAAPGPKGISYGYGADDSIAVTRIGSDSLNVLFAGRITPWGIGTYTFHRLVTTNRSIRIEETKRDSRWQYKVEILRPLKIRKSTDTLAIQRTTTLTVLDTHWPCAPDSSDAILTVAAEDLLSHRTIHHAFPYRREKRRYQDTTLSILRIGDAPGPGPGAESGASKYRKHSDSFLDSSASGSMKIFANAEPSLGATTLFSVQVNAESTGGTGREFFREDSAQVDLVACDTIDNIAVTRRIEFRKRP